MAGSTFTAFNSMLREFFSDLSDTFDEYTVISDAKSLLDVALAADSSTDVPMTTFIEVFSPHESLIMEKDPSLFKVCQIPMISEGGFDMAKEWETLEDENKDAIWNYIQQLYLTGKTVLSLDKTMLSSIEGFANSCMNDVNGGKMTAEEAQNPMVILQKMMQNPEMMAAFGGGSSTEEQMNVVKQAMSKK